MRSAGGGTRPAGPVAAPAARDVRGAGDVADQLEGVVDVRRCAEHPQLPVVLLRHLDLVAVGSADRVLRGAGAAAADGQLPETGRACLCWCWLEANDPAAGGELLRQARQLLQVLLRVLAHRVLHVVVTARRCAGRGLRDSAAGARSPDRAVGGAACRSARWSAGDSAARRDRGGQAGRGGPGRGGGGCAPRRSSAPAAARQRGRSSRAPGGRGSVTSGAGRGPTRPHRMSGASGSARHHPLADDLEGLRDRLSLAGAIIETRTARQAARCGPVGTVMSAG